MAFKTTVLDKDSNVKGWETLDSEICELRGVPKDELYYRCKPPVKSYSSHWKRLLSHCVMLTRAYNSYNQTYLASDFFKGLLEFGRWRSSQDNIHANRYEIQPILFWIDQGYQFKVENKW